MLVWSARRSVTGIWVMTEVQIQAGQLLSIGGTEGKLWCAWPRSAAKPAKLCPPIPTGLPTTSCSMLCWAGLKDDSGRHEKSRNRREYSNVNSRSEVEYCRILPGWRLWFVRGAHAMGELKTSRGKLVKWTRILKLQQFGLFLVVPDHVT